MAARRGSGSSHIFHLVAFLLTFVIEEKKFIMPMDIPTMIEPLDQDQ
jgi:hypothetical protein